MTTLAPTSTGSFRSGNFSSIFSLSPSLSRYVSLSCYLNLYADATKRNDGARAFLLWFSGGRTSRPDRLAGGGVHGGMLLFHYSDPIFQRSIAPTCKLHGLAVRSHPC